MSGQEFAAQSSAPQEGPKLSCAEALRQIDCLVEEGELKPAERTLLFAHLGSCRACRADLEQRRRVEARVREVFSALDTSPTFTPQVLAALAGKHPAHAGAPDQEGEAPSPGPLERLTRVIGGLGWGLWAAAATLLVLGPLTLWLQLRGGQGAEAVASLASCEGLAVLVRDGNEMPARAGLPLRRGDVLRPGPSPDERALLFGIAADGLRLADVRLAGGAKLRVEGRVHYFVEQGETYFLVHGQPQHGADYFDVETPLGRVLVLGTAFGVVVPSGHAEVVTVLVDAGRVRVLPWSGPEQTLEKGQECDLLKTGGASPPRAIQPGRLGRLRPEAGAASAPAREAPVERPQPSPAAPPRLDWDTPVSGIDFRGCALPQSLGRLAQHLGGAEELQGLVRASALFNAEATSGLVLRRPMPPAAVVRWLARESGLRFVSPGTLRPAKPDEELGPPEPGALPPDWQAALDTAAEGAAMSGEALADLNALAARAWITLLADVDPRLRCQLPTGAGLTLRAVLGQLAAAGLDWAYYDGLVYVAPAPVLWKLTFVPRTRNVAAWVGRDLVPEWGLSLRNLAQSLGSHQDGRPALAPAVSPVLANVSLMPEEPRLHFTSGLSGTRTLSAALRLLEQGSPAAASPVAMLDAYLVPGALRDWDELAQQAALRHTPVELRVPGRPFPAQAFLVQPMPLGQALEWAARLQGLGLRSEDGRVVVDKEDACYGPPMLQAVNLAALSRRRPELSRELPRALASLSQAVFPELLRGTEWFAVCDVLAFQGERRQLAAVQRMARELDSALAAWPALAKFDLHGWRPAWRRELEANLAEPVSGDRSGLLPAGAFAAVLRQSGLLAQLRATVLVDPQAMEHAAAQAIPALDVRNLTLGQALGKLSAAAGLRMVLEDKVVWLRE